jgi:hypothetical protein
MIDVFDDAQLDADVCIYDTGIDEYFQLQVELVFATDAQDVVNINHPIIRF